MNRKLLVGLNADLRSATSKAGEFSYIMSGYYKCVRATGGVPMVLPPMDEDDINQALDNLDAFVLVGGLDLDPRRDGFMMHPTVRTLDPEREEFDRLLAAKLIERNIPVFGIGVGMQLINVTMGGNLSLHIPEDFPDALPHLDTQDADHRHSLDIVQNSLMERVFGDGEIRVNSRHHMAVDELAPGLRVTARCPDGIIEAFESASPDSVILGTQFHPESDSASALDVRIFEEFFDDVKAHLAAPVEEPAMV